MVTAMINIYIRDQSSSSNHSLAISLGHPALTKEGEEDEREARRRIMDTYKKIFPGCNENKSNLAEAGEVCSVSAAACSVSAAADAVAPSVAMKSCAACARCFSRAH
jgi:hypothetical protein